MARVFISYASPDAVFALRLATGIELLGHAVWIDQWEIAVGDSPFRQVGEGIDRAEFLIVVLSKHTMRSAWVEAEWQIKYGEEFAQRRTIILPVMIEDCPIPVLLRHKRFADFRAHYEIGFAQLAITLHTRRHDTSTLSSHSDIKRELTQPSPAPHYPDAAACYTDTMVSIPSKIVEIGVELGVPYLGKITGTWKADETEQQAAWELYIELVTRVPVAELHTEEGSLREALSSLYALFTITRDILRRHGPAIAHPKPGSDVSFGYLAITILNHVVRPILATWHPLLLDYEQIREPSISAVEHERRWNKATELRHALQDARGVLVNYTNLLAKVAGSPPLYQ
jgi:TIR domain